jgi:hypothetical protein
VARCSAVDDFGSLELARRDPVAFARAVGAAIAGPDPPVDELEALLDGWAGGADDDLAVAAVHAYAEVARVRPEWRADETRKLTAALHHPSVAVRQAASAALQRIGVFRAGATRTKPSDAPKHSDGSAGRGPST